MCWDTAHLYSEGRMVKSPKDTLLEQERFELKPKSGGGILNYEVWGYVSMGKTVVTRYNP
jgi:hypothetical protein